MLPPRQTGPLLDATGVAGIEGLANDCVIVFDTQLVVAPCILIE